jgi:hypothetical protein
MYYGQNDGTTVPDLVMTGDPGVDNAALTANGYLSGSIMSIKNGSTSTTQTGLVVHPLDGASTTEVPYGTLLLGAGQFSSSITPSGSGRTPVVRAFAKFNVPAGAFVSTDTFVVGQYLYTAAGANKGQYTVLKTGATGAAGLIPVGICTHIPTQSQEPWLGVASLL